MRQGFMQLAGATLKCWGKSGTATDIRAAGSFVSESTGLGLAVSLVILRAIRLVTTAGY